MAGDGGDWIDPGSTALTRTIINSIITVHRVLGPGFVEAVYQRALIVELTKRRLPLATEVVVHVEYDGQPVGTHRLDLVVAGEIIVELKAVKALEEIHFAQLKSYLKATQLRVGLLLNFNAPMLVVKRLVL